MMEQKPVRIETGKRYKFFLSEYEVTLINKINLSSKNYVPVKVLVQVNLKSEIREVGIRSIYDLYGCDILFSGVVSKIHSINDNSPISPREIYLTIVKPEIIYHAESL